MNNLTTPKNDNQSWLDKLSDLLLREPKDREQLLKLLRDAEQRDLFNSDALAMLEGVLQVSELQVKNIMINHKDMKCIMENDSFNDLINTIVTTKHSRFPVFNVQKTEIKGLLHAKEILPFLINKNESFDIHTVLRPAMFIPENKRLDILLKELKNSKIHMAIVIDEYGSIMGLVTLEDVLEQIIGDIDEI